MHEEIQILNLEHIYEKGKNDKIMSRSDFRTLFSAIKIPWHLIMKADMGSSYKTIIKFWIQFTFSFEIFTLEVDISKALCEITLWWILYYWRHVKILKWELCILYKYQELRILEKKHFVFIIDTLVAKNCLGDCGIWWIHHLLTSTSFSGN